MSTEPEEIDPRRRIRRRSVLCIAGGLLVTVTLWCALWVYFAHQLENTIGRWAEQRRERGWSVTWQSLEIAGFPLRWEARVGQAQAIRTDAGPAWFWQAAEPVTLSYRPWQPRRFAISAPGLHRFGSDPGRAADAISLRAAPLAARMDFDEGGRLRRTRVVLGGATLTRASAPPTQIEYLDATWTAAPAESAPAGAPHLRAGMRLQGVLGGLTLPEDTRPVLGRQIASLVLDARLMGRLEPGTLAESLTLWRDDGGTVEIGELALAWGPLSVEGDGTLAVDEALQPQAAFSTRISGYTQTVDALVRSGVVPPNAAFLAKLALGALARTPEGGGPPRLEVPVTIQERRLYVGPVGLLTLPAIDWSGF